LILDTSRKPYRSRLNKHNKFFNPKSTRSKRVQYTPDKIVMPKNYKKYQGERTFEECTECYQFDTDLSRADIGFSDLRYANLSGADG
jgi:uncharacterized protein YjbI with pentapeptide repeats